MMDDLVVCFASHNELDRRGEAVLRRSLDSLSTSMAVLARTVPGVDVYVAGCDDASTDGTPDYLEKYFQGKAWFRLARNGVNRYEGFSRNVAASLFPASLLCFLDPDDEYKPDHLAICYNGLCKTVAPAGKKFAMATTNVEFSVPVHAEWMQTLGAVIPITKAVRREAWEFVEGMPMEQVYRHTTCVDQFFIQKIATFFPVLRFNDVTAKYWCYPGSALARQLPIFQKPRSQCKPGDVYSPEELTCHDLRQRCEDAFMDYLRDKLEVMGWRERLSEFSVNIPSNHGKLNHADRSRVMFYDAS
jgi:glycosyltransferase involved in cell wall biosynthesis